MNRLQQDIERYYQLQGNPREAGVWLILLSSFNPRLLPIVIFRLSCFCFNYRLNVVAKLFSSLNLLLFGLETSPRVDIQGGLFLPHTVGTVLGAKSIGENVTILHGVTLGAKEIDFGYSPELRPIIGDNVFIGPGATIIGPVRIGNGAKIGANAVVMKDVPANALAVGVPAKLKNID